MSFTSRKRDMKREVLSAWFDHVLGTYPAASAKAISGNSNQFANPVGNTLNESLSVLFDELREEADLERAGKALDSIIRIRAVQDFTASGAVGFVVALKGIMRQVLGEDAGTPAEWRELDQRVDSMMLAAFYIYNECRKAIYEIRAEEVKRQVHMLLKKAGAVQE